MALISAGSQMSRLIQQTERFLKTENIPQNFYESRIGLFSGPVRRNYTKYTGGMKSKGKIDEYESLSGNFVSRLRMTKSQTKEAKQINQIPFDDAEEFQAKVYSKIFSSQNVLCSCWTTLPENCSTVGRNSPSMYVYEADPMSLRIPVWQSFFRLRMPFFISYCKEPIYHSLKETDSPDPETRASAIKKVAESNGLSEMQCYTVSQSVSLRTAIALANSAADPRMIPTPRGISQYRENVTLPAKMREILTVLPPKNIHEGVLAEALDAISAFDPTYEEYYASQLEFARSFDSDLHAFTNPTRRFSEVRFLIPCLNAILSHSRLYDQIPVITGLGVLHLLHSICEKHRGNNEIMSIVIKIISNVSWHPDSTEYIARAGLLPVISQLSLNDDIRLCLPARKALHNLDREGAKDPVTPPGVYQLYPSFRFDNRDLDVDIIFVHGIMGGVFRTWRQHDRAYNATSDGAGLMSMTDMRDRAYHLRNRAKNQKLLLPLDIESEVSAEVDAEARSVLIERLLRLRNRIPFIYGPNVKVDSEFEYKPANRELRNGVMYSFPEDEKIILEPSNPPPTDSTKCWPKDWLPKDVHGARIIGVDFESFITRWNPVRPIESLSRSLVERSSEILDKLASVDVGRRPIIWVAHSAGGLLVKELLLQAAASKDPNKKSISLNTEAILFYGVPHFGAQLGAMTTAGKLFLLPTLEIKELNPDSVQLQALNDEFLVHLQKHPYRIISFGEMAQMLNIVVGIPGKLVSLKSSDPGYGEYYALDLNHLEICKPISRGSFIYRKLVDVVIEARKSSERFKKPDRLENDKSEA